MQQLSNGSEAFNVFAMNRKGLAVVQGLIEQLGASRIGYVVGATDSSVQNDYSREIREICAGNGIAFFDRLEPPCGNGLVSFAVGWRWIIRNVERLVILHDSLLPRLRGFAPLPTALINGHTRIGVTALLAADEYDRGPIVGQRGIDISYPLRIADAIELVSGLYAELIVSVAGTLLRDGTLRGVEQDEGDASYSHWRDELDYAIDWTSDAVSIARFVDAVGYPYRGAESRMGDARVRVLSAEPVTDVRIEGRVAGKVVFVDDGIPIVACGTGLLRLTDLRHTDGSSVLPLKRFRTRFA